ncbi:HPr kinase/phosphorylase [Hoeflea ulvae]|uniref:HPr kinase/phosphatase C-terminal domain-containing protein n=1 Tax=Hoeflea ulvae TaxID=2983764 RepID=A0ABT3YAD3_9HYPH|nr:HPr kinase/phosphatase C-terminal domain-containing protein [Hoeflea ulvae]MCY0092846.1 HPr kinase/phosphatase C-terminal domain-containing protein [Hoeflea ulvae]
MSSVSAVSGESFHATAIISGATGVLFLGPSGSGKSAVAFACLNATIARGWNAALVADDQTILTAGAGRCIASCPPPIQGLLELRGTGIVAMRRSERAVMHLAVALTERSSETRSPPESETFSCGDASLPLMRLWHDGTSDPLDYLIASRPELFFSR